MLTPPRTKRFVTAVLILVNLGLGLACFTALNRSREDARLAGCISNIRSIGLACAKYADSLNGLLPRKFDDLRGTFAAPEWFVCPSAKDRVHPSYEFTGTTNIWGVSSNIVIFREIEPNHHGLRVGLYDDGHFGLEHAQP